MGEESPYPNKEITYKQYTWSLYSTLQVARNSDQLFVRQRYKGIKKKHIPASWGVLGGKICGTWKHRLFCTYYAIYFSHSKIVTQQPLFSCAFARCRSEPRPSTQIGSFCIGPPRVYYLLSKHTAISVHKKTILFSFFYGTFKFKLISRG